MTDRELLDMAAKAAGIDQNWDGLFWQWNPLTDDGDALRLAVKLRLDIDFDPAGDFVCVQYATNNDSAWFQRIENDDSAATRRAIVRAAAAIGKAMP